MTSQAALSLLTAVMARRAIAGLLLYGCASLAAAQPYVIDSGFNQGQWFLDAFAGSAAQDHAGRRIARLSDGGSVVAGVVPGSEGKPALGLVRYSSNGERQTWLTPGEFGHYGNQYVIYPVPFGATEDVLDLVRYGERLFVLAHGWKYRFSTQPPFEPRFAGHTVEVLVFGTDGSLRQRQIVDEDDDVDTRRALAGGIAVYADDAGSISSPVSLVYGGTRIDGATRRATFRRYSVGGDSSLTAATGLVYPNPGGGACSAGCEINGLRTGSRPGNGIPRIYVAGSYSNGTQWDIAVMQLSASGLPTGSFAGDGLQTVGFNLAGGTLHDYGRALAVTPGSNASAGNDDRIYVAADVAVHCGNAAGVIKLRGDGTADNGFGPGGLGRYYFGGPQIPSGSFCVSPSADAFAQDIAIADGKVALAGERKVESIFIGGELQVDGLLAVMSESGVMQSLDWYPYREGGARARHSAFHGITPGGSESFIVSGNVRYFDDAGANAGHTQYATLRLAPRRDPIFANGFQQP